MTLLTESQWRNQVSRCTNRKSVLSGLTCNQNATESDQFRAVDTSAKVADDWVEKEPANVVADQNDGGHSRRKRIPLFDGA